MVYWNNFKVENGQSAALNLSNEQIQVLLTGKFGDGCFVQTAYSVYYSACSIYEEYIDFKASLLGDLFHHKTTVLNKGFKENNIFRLYTGTDPRTAFICDESIEDSFARMDGLGLALWVYDDGSLHKTKHFYQINTQKYSREVLEDIFVPGLKSKFDITAKTTAERKKDGREFWYLRISKYEGSNIISDALSKYPVNCYNYKVWSSETIQKWSRLQEESKSAGIDLSSLDNRTLSLMLKKIAV